MKNLIIVFVLSLGSLGCENFSEPLVYSGCARKVINDVVFEYCLLNIDMEPTAQLKAGENFYFRFSVRNNTNRNFYFYPHFANDDENDFCAVYTEEGQSFGKPYVFKAVELIGIAAWSFPPNKEYVFLQPWLDSRDTSWTWQRGVYSSTNQTPLPAGKYSTSFTETFKFEVPLSDKELKIEEITFKIDFNVN